MSYYEVTSWRDPTDFSVIWMKDSGTMTYVATLNERCISHKKTGMYLRPLVQEKKHDEN